MIDDHPLSRFDLAAGDLARLGITLRRLPGSDATARIVETIDEALAAGRAMAAEVVPAKPAQKDKRRRLYMSAKAARRAFIKAHNRRMRTRALKHQREHE